MLVGNSYTTGNYFRRLTLSLKVIWDQKIIPKSIVRLSAMIVTRHDQWGLLIITYVSVQYYVTHYYDTIIIGIDFNRVDIRCTSCSYYYMQKCL